MGRFVTKLIRDFDDVWLLELSGDIEPDLDRPVSSIEAVVILRILEQVRMRRLIIDLSAVPQLDPQWLQFLALLHKQLAKRNVQIVLRQPNPDLQAVLQSMRYDQFFMVEGVDGVGGR